ncbi:3-deoxy-manno-octulosonate cytidylyltransferase [Candidatus Sumerlaeota bacterium]|nr:3-deoxy-manno-octulosonate cytidylyltransferase [Candidatus Sumerlaeota bacterium]
MKTVCVIPARFGSQRLPGKPMMLLRGRPMIQWVIEAARQFSVANEILVATDHEKIARAARDVGAEAVLTDPELPSGTDRIHAAMKGRHGDIIINLQGDEPGMPGETVARAHAALLATNADVATACVPLHRREDFESPNVVKVVRGDGDRALYFSRSPIPSLARRSEGELNTPGTLLGHKHLGLYIYRRAALEGFCALPPSPLELTEKLEQLRMLENGMTIVCVTSTADSVGVDVAEDVGRAEEFLGRSG